MEAEILACLREVREPNLNRDVVSLKMVAQAEIDGDIARVTLELPYTDKATRDEILEETNRALSESGFQPKVRLRPRDTSEWEEPGKKTTIKHVVLIVSGKGGVGKSTVSTNLALALKNQGMSVGLLDADIYGPSIPTMMGVLETPRITDEQKLIPLKAHGISLMSSGFLIEEDKALVWRGPMIHKIVTQFMQDVAWGELDVLLVDLPPGTGDVQLSLSQSIPVRGAVLVSTPQQVAIADVVRAKSMLDTLSIPILGIVENMSGFLNPATKEIIPVFSEGGGERLSHKFGTELLGKIPLDPQVCSHGDSGIPIVTGEPDSPGAQAFQAAAQALTRQLNLFEEQKLSSKVVKTGR